jgi:hypothetical protein
MTLCQTLDRVAKGGVAFAGSARSDPRVWYGRPDGAGEAALPHRPIRGCHGTRGSTLTSWRRGRGRGEPQGRTSAGDPVGCRRRSERRMLAVGPTRSSGLSCQDPFGSPTAMQASQTRAWPHHAQPDSATSPDAHASRRFGVTILGGHDPAGSPDPWGSLVESLILAQDQRWRRA